MEVKAIAKNQRVQPRKVRIVADELRGKSAVRAAALLQYQPSKGARVLRKVLISAIANAENNNGVSAESLKISTIMVDEGPRLKRIQARAMGRANRIVKKTAHITVVLEDFEPQPAAKVQTTKPKPRPTFAAPKKKGGKAAKAAVTEPVEDVPVEEVVEEKVEEVAAEVTTEETAEAPVQEPANDETPPADGATTDEKEAK
jgi:large subunit ribosomal protein L22